MILDKLVTFSGPPEEVFYNLRYNLVENGFTIRDENLDEMTFFCMSRVNGSRVDLKGMCLPGGEGVVVQLLYSPAFTPSTERPVFLNKNDQEALIEDLNLVLNEILDKTGSWSEVSQSQVLDQTGSTLNREEEKKKAKRSLAVPRLVAWLVLLVVAGTLSYLTFDNGIGFGPYEVWLLLSLVAVFALLLEFFLWFSQRRKSK